MQDNPNRPTRAAYMDNLSNRVNGQFVQPPDTKEGAVASAFSWYPGFLRAGTPSPNLGFCRRSAPPYTTPWAEGGGEMVRMHLYAVPSVRRIRQIVQ